MDTKSFDVYKNAGFEKTYDAPRKKRNTTYKNNATNINDFNNVVYKVSDDLLKELPVPAKILGGFILKKVIDTYIKP